MDAAKRLSPSAFEIYLYLVSNNGNIQNLSPKDIENSLGIKRATYYEALGKLEEAGYLYREDGVLKFCASCRKNVRAGIQDLENNGLIER